MSPPPPAMLLLYLNTQNQPLQDSDVTADLKLSDSKQANLLKLGPATNCTFYIQGNAQGKLNLNQQSPIGRSLISI